MEERFVQVADLRHPRRDGAEVEVPRIEVRLELLPEDAERLLDASCRVDRVAGAGGVDVEEDVVGALRLVAAGRPGRGA